MTNAIYFRVLAEMQEGRLFTHDDLNKEVPEGCQIFASNILRRIREDSNDVISFKHATKNTPAYWYIKNKAKQQEEASKNHNQSCIKEFATRRDNNFITEALTK